MSAATTINSSLSHELTLDTLQASIRTCTRCAALVRCRSQVVPGAGAIGAAVAFVGIAPGRFGGDRTGVPFSGDRSGTLLRTMIATAGLREVFITNLVRCNPRDSKGRNRDPRPREIANCRQHLEAELALVRPKVVVCLGATAWRHLAGVNAFKPRRPASYRVNGWLLYPMYHPAYVNRGAYPIASYVHDFSRLGRFIARNLGPDTGQTTSRIGIRTHGEEKHHTAILNRNYRYGERP